MIICSDKVFKFEKKKLTEKSIIQNKKLELIQRVSVVESLSTLEKISDLLEKEEQQSDWWNAISQEERESIEKGLADAASGNVHPQSKAKEIYGKWL